MTTRRRVTTAMHAQRLTPAPRGFVLATIRFSAPPATNATAQEPAIQPLENVQILSLPMELLVMIPTSAQRLIFVRQEPVQLALPLNVLRSTNAMRQGPVIQPPGRVQPPNSQMERHAMTAMLAPQPTSASPALAAAMTPFNVSPWTNAMTWEPVTRTPDLAQTRLSRMVRHVTMPTHAR